MTSPSSNQSKEELCKYDVIVACGKQEVCVGEIVCSGFTMKITPTTYPILKRHLMKLIKKRLVQAQKDFDDKQVIET